MDTLDHLSEILSAYEGTLIIVSHDRDFLDQTVSKILAFEGRGDVEGYIGGYSDYIEAKKIKLMAERGDAGDNAPSSKKQKIKKAPIDQNAVNVPDASEPSPLQDTAPPHAIAQAPAKLSYKLMYELEKLPEKIKNLEDEIATLEAKMANADFYMQDPEGFDKTARRIGRACTELEDAERRWLELEDMRTGNKQS
jgi:ATP-binding cassette subfamily F protein uup